MRRAALSQCCNRCLASAFSTSHRSKLPAGRRVLPFRAHSTAGQASRRLLLRYLGGVTLLTGVYGAMSSTCRFALGAAAAAAGQSQAEQVF